MKHLHCAEFNIFKLHLSTLLMCLRGLYRVKFTLEKNTNNDGAPRHCCASSCCQHTSLLSCGFCVSSLALNRSETLIRNRSCCCCCCCCCCCRICLALRSTRVRSPQWTDDLTHPAPATVLPAARCSWKMHLKVHQPWYRMFHGFKLRENPH